MCGIAGIVLPQGEQVQEGLLRAMTDRMTHRGPDDEGLFRFGNAAIGMRRLSIMDVAHGGQPLMSQDGMVAMVGNGEIYNFRQLRQRLAHRHDFRTTTDMEVVAPSYLEWGIHFAQQFEGMFGLAVLDMAQGKLHLIRDLRGIKPLFVAETGRAVVFSSDINSIFASGHIAPRLNPEAAATYFNYRFGALGDSTFFEGIRLMWPGEVLTIDTATLRVSSSFYHNSIRYTDEPLLTGTEADMADGLDQRLRASVTKRLMADVPLGTLLSSGVDSTLLTAIANAVHDRKVDAFTIGYAEQSHDESAGAGETARHLGIQWHRHEVSCAEFTSLIVPCIEKNEAPISHENNIPVHLITKLAHDLGYKVLLSGEGADELFAGYGRTQSLMRLHELSRKYPLLLLQLAARLGLKFDSREAQVLSALSRKDASALLVSYFSVVEQDFMAAGAPPRFLDQMAGGIDFARLLQRILQCEQRTYLQELLLRQDKMSMMSSIEVRVPFVGDPEMVGYANRLPDLMKLRDGTNKYLLRKVAERYVPKEIAHRRKRGFGSPLSDWLRQDGDLTALARSLADSPLMDTGQRKFYQQMLDEHMGGSAQRHDIIWKVMNWLLFRQQYGV